jgi:hypothetical protein
MSDLYYHVGQFTYAVRFSLGMLFLGWFISVIILYLIGCQTKLFEVLNSCPGSLVDWFTPDLLGLSRQDCFIIAIPWPGCLICKYTSTKPSDWLVNVDQTVGLAGLHRASCLIGWFKSTRQSHWQFYVKQTV